jgi:hypothetical protein
MPETPMLMTAIEKTADLLIALRALEHIPEDKSALKAELAASLPAMLGESITALRALEAQFT